MLEGLRWNVLDPVVRGVQDNEATQIGRKLVRYQVWSLTKLMFALWYTLHLSAWIAEKINDSRWEHTQQLPCIGLCQRPMTLEMLLELTRNQGHSCLVCHILLGGLRTPSATADTNIEKCFCVFVKPPQTVKSKQKSSITGQTWSAITLPR